MANSITGPIWRIDTLPFTYSGQVKIKSAQWSDQVTAADQIVFNDGVGRTVIDTKAQQANFLQDFSEKGWIPGLVGVTLGSGVLLIAIGATK